MSITTVALVKLPKSVFDALPRADEAPSDPSNVRVRVGSGSCELRLLDDGALVYTPVAFDREPDEVIDVLWDLFGDHFADHDDDRGVFVIPSVARPRMGTYAAVIEEIGDVGEWIAIDEDGDDADEARGEVVDADAPPGDLMSMIAGITSSLGPDAMQSIQSAMMSGDPRALAAAQQRMAATLSQRGDLMAQIQGLMGMLPPELVNMAMSTPPDALLQKMQGGLAPEQLAALRAQLGDADPTKKPAKGR